MCQNSDQNFQFVSGEKNNYHQNDNNYLQYEMTVVKNVANAVDRILIDGDAIRQVKNDFAYCFKETRLVTTGCQKLEQKMKYAGQVSTFMGALTSKAGDIKSHFDKIDESDAEISNSSVKHLRVNNHDMPVNKEKIGAQLRLEIFFGFCKSSKKITKQIDHDLTF